MDLEGQELVGEARGFVANEVVTSSWQLRLYLRSLVTGPDASDQIINLRLALGMITDARC